MMNDENKREKRIQALEDELNSLKKDSNISHKKRKTNSKVIYEWKAPTRVFKKWEREKLYTVFLWLIVIIVILLFFKEYATIFIIFALGFVIYAMVSYPPESIDHIITEDYVVWFEKKYYFEDLEDFWFSKRSDQLILNIETKYNLIARLVYLVNEKEKEDLLKILSLHLPYKEIEKQNFLSKITDGVYIENELL